MRSINFILAVAPAVALTVAAMPASAAVGDFRLPPAQGDQQPPPDRQGPVAPDVPESRRPAPTPTPSPTAAAPLPTPTPTPTITLPEVTLPPPAPTTRPSAAPVGAAPPVAVSPTATPALQVEPSSVPAQSPGAAPAPPAAAPVGNATEAVETDGGSSSSWLWIAIALALGAGLGLAGLLLLRRRRAAGASAVPEIERPRIAPEPPATVPPKPASAVPAQPRPVPAAPLDAAAEPLQVSLEPLRLSLTLMNAALAYRLEIANRGTTPLTGLTIGADMISAHASMTREEQLSGPANGAAAVHRIERLEPGQSRVVEGEFRLPFGQIVPIRQGNAALLLPLARFRVEAEGSRPVVRTFAVGQPGQGSALQPFRLDQGPRIYPKLAQHAFA